MNFGKYTAPAEIRMRWPFTCDACAQSHPCGSPCTDIREPCDNALYPDLKMTMPGISIELNGSHIATICLAGMDIVDVSVHGALDQDPKASLDATGGKYLDGERGHRIWISAQSLLPGEALSVKLIAACDSADQGRTMQEVFPGEELPARIDFTIGDDMAAELRSRPRLHEAFAVQVDTSHGQQATATSNEANTSFTFRVLWDFTRPSQARVLLKTHCVEDVLARRAGTAHLEAVLSFGDSASFSLLA